MLPSSTAETARGCGGSGIGAGGAPARPSGAGPVLLLAIGVAALLAIAVTPSCILDRLGTSPDANFGGGGGSSVPCETAEDCPGLDTTCKTRNCVSNSCGFIYHAGDPCTEDGGQYCDTIGQCVECVEDAHCTPLICRQGQCVSQQCADGALNGDETDVDCGGTCPPCENGRGCQVAEDCASLFCDGGTCAACADEGQCPDGHFCDGGVCTPKKPNGEDCSTAEECASGNCPGDDGVCCDDACTALCMACLQGKTGQPNGECRAALAGTNENSECPDEGVCGSNGQGCNGLDPPGCIQYPINTPCGDAQACSGGYETHQDTCNGSGNCTDNGGEDCDPYVCSGAFCLDDCASGGHSDCLTGHYCDNLDHCVDQGDIGASCTQNVHCLNNRCIDNRCCDSACTGACFTCNGSNPGYCTGDTCTCNQQYGGEAGYQLCNQSPQQCRFFVTTGGRSCNEVCQANGGECDDAQDGDPPAYCTDTGDNVNCGTTGYGDMICICSRGCDGSPRCMPGETCSSGTCS